MGKNPQKRAIFMQKRIIFVENACKYIPEWYSNSVSGIYHKKGKNL